MVAGADEKPEFEDYCRRLEQEIQGRKHGFLAGNVSYYVGGFHASWKLVEDETLGLTHPFHHDLRSRGVGILSSQLKGTENTGSGNDYRGWEFYKDTRVLYGSVIIDGKSFKNPRPKSMVWRPDKLICRYHVGGVDIVEEKFIAANDGAASIIRSSKPVILQFAGHSFFHRNSVTSTASIRMDVSGRQLLLKEGGTVRSKPDPQGPERIGPCVYSGMTTVLGSSKDFVEKVQTRKDDRGVIHYSFQVPCDQEGTVVTWAMNDKEEVACRHAKALAREPNQWLKRKTKEMNRLLNEEVPFFRCPDRKFVDIYYFLWSLYLMYYIDVDRGWEQENHTQTAVNNFLGMHRYDAAFQIKVGAWTNDKKRWAYGNVLTWKHLTENNRFRELENGIRLLSDNKGIAWHSGAYGGETTEHVLGAWQIFEHTGDKSFLKSCYEGHFRKLFWKQLGSFSMNRFEVAEKLAQMAVLSGNDGDVEHWQRMVSRDPEHIRKMFAQRWESNGIENYFAGPKDGMIMTNGFWVLRSPYFPREYARQMVEAWAVDKEKGFFGEFFPLAMSRQAMKNFASQVDHSFGYTPDTAYFMIDGMFKQEVFPEATELALNHIANYNFHPQWKIPVAPEAYQRDLKLFGDQYSNFNAGKILLFLEGFAGLKYSIPDRELQVRAALPSNWDWMEVRLPIDGKWTRIRYTNEGVKVSGCPLKVQILAEKR